MTGEKFKVLRTNLGLTQKEMGKLFGVTNRTIFTAEGKEGVLISRKLQIRLEELKKSGRIKRSKLVDISFLTEVRKEEIKSKTKGKFEGLVMEVVSPEFQKLKDEIDTIKEFIVDIGVDDLMDLVEKKRNAKADKGSKTG